MEEVKWLIVGMGSLSILYKIGEIILAAGSNTKEEIKYKRSRIYGSLLGTLIWFYIIIKLL